MQTISDYSEKFDAMVNQYLEPAVTQKYVLPVLALILILYVSHVRPTLPNFVVELFQNNIFRFVVFTYIVYRANHDPQSAVLIAALFLIIMHMVNKQYIDKFANIPSKSVSGCKEIVSNLPATVTKTTKDDLTNRCNKIEKVYESAQKEQKVLRFDGTCYLDNVIRSASGLGQQFTGELAKLNPNPPALNKQPCMMTIPPPQKK
jgi:hypothetical protein